MATFHETAVSDTIAATRLNVVTLSVDEGDDVIDAECSDVHGNVGLRLSIEESLALIASLSGAINAALHNRRGEDES